MKLDLSRPLRRPNVIMAHKKIFRIIGIIFLLYRLPPGFTNISPQVTFTSIIYHTEKFPFGLLGPHRPENSKGRNVISLFLLRPIEKSLP